LFSLYIYIYIYIYIYVCVCVCVCVARKGKKRNVYRLLGGKPEGKRPLGRKRSRWIDNIKMDPIKIRFSVVDWIGLAQDRYRC
jgi:hypothetical protein